MISFECRDNLGWTNMYDSPYNDYFDFKSNTINFLLGISYQLKKNKE